MDARSTTSDRAAGVVLRQPTVADASGMMSLVRNSPPLDINSAYAYLLLAAHFSATCRIAEDLFGLCGMVTGYRRPDQLDTLFVWQVAVAPRVRGQGIARQLVADVTRDAQWVEATVNPGNRPSEALFQRLAHERGELLTCTSLFTKEHFQRGGDNVHAEEVLYRIGPRPEAS